MRVAIVVVWLLALGAFFVLGRPAPPRPVLYLADPVVAAWVAAAAEHEAQQSRVTIRPVPPGTDPDLRIGRLAGGANVAKTRLVVAAWRGSAGDQVANPAGLAAWLEAVRDGRVRFAVPGQKSRLGEDFVALVGRLDGQATTDFYRGADRLRDLDELYLDDFRNFGPARWDAGILYEDAALQINQTRAEQAVEPLLRLHYLEGAPDIMYRAEGKNAGDRLIAGLASPTGQDLALDHGIRPLDPSADSAGSLFKRFSDLGAQAPR